MKISILRVLMLFGAVINFAVTVHADSNLDCVADSNGRKIRWNSSWGTDRVDNNTIYRVTGVSQFDKIPLRKITIEFSAVGPANLRSRTMTITTEDRARALCDNLVVEREQLKFPELDSANVEQLPFIRFTKDGWLRSDPPTNIQFAVCNVGTLRFSCTQSDRDRFGSSLHTLEEELNAQN